jgi:hypothetical protein
LTKLRAPRTETKDPFAMRRPTGQALQGLLRHKLAASLAAILLILHWAAPTFRPIELPQSYRSPIPVYTIAEIGLHHGTLPRLLGRVHGETATLPKLSRNQPKSDDADIGPAATGTFALLTSKAISLRMAATSLCLAGTEPQFRARAPPATA